MVNILKTNNNMQVAHQIKIYDDANSLRLLASELDSRATHWAEVARRSRANQNALYAAAYLALRETAASLKKIVDEISCHNTENTARPEEPICNKVLKFYVASKTTHAEFWKHQRREFGCQIISTWIDEAGEGQTANYSELAQRCISEVQKADVLVLYCEPGELLKGALIEVGAALALGKEVRCVGNCDSLSRVFVKHPKWRNFVSMFDAFSAKPI